MIARAARGDNNAFEMLMEPQLKIIYSYIRSKTGNEEDQNDLLQETLFSVWRNLHNFSGQSRFQTWVFSIARHKIADFYRSRGRRAENGAQDLSYAENMPAADEMEQITERLSIEAALQRLGEAERELLFLIFNAQLSYREVSELLQIPVGTVKSRFHAVKSKLSQTLR